MGIEEGKEVKANGIKNIFNEVMSENFPNIEKEVNTQIQEMYRTPPKTRPEKRIIMPHNSQIDQHRS